MTIRYDPAKRERTLRERGLDFEDAGAIFEGTAFTIADRRFDYGEERFITFALTRERMMVVVWTWRGDDRHVISMRKANDREQARYRARLD